jgi:uncharacterized protein (TIGR02145 family)
MKTKILLCAIMAISSIMVNAQTTMNIHQSNGTVLQIPLNTIDSITYAITNPINLATLMTLPIVDVTSTTALLGGEIIDDGGTPVIVRGVVYSTTPNPITTNNGTMDGNGVGSFTSNLSSLIPNTTYYVRAYAINGVGTAYGNELSFTTLEDGNIIVSIPGAGVTFDGYNYMSVVLGNGQEWMAENLRTTVYANGDLITNVPGPQWSSFVSGAWAYYDNNSQFANPYGKLYNGYAVSDIRNVCPSGWHVPTDIEWNVFIEYLDSAYNILPPNTTGTQSAYAGSKIKSIGTQYWLSPNADATNLSGFSGLPGGYRSGGGDFDLIGYGGLWWSSTNGFGRAVNNDSGALVKINDGLGAGLSVRCLKD